jgi:hypothetical protein
VIGKRAEGLGPQRDPFVEPPRAVGIEGNGGHEE